MEHFQVLFMDTMVEKAKKARTLYNQQRVGGEADRLNGEVFTTRLASSNSPKNIMWLALHLL